MGHLVSLAKTKTQVFGGLLDGTVEPDNEFGEDVKNVEIYTYLCPVVHSCEGL